MFCGDGEMNVDGYVEELWASGYRGPIGIEVLSAEAREWPLERIVTYAFETTMAPFEKLFQKSAQD